MLGLDLTIRDNDIVDVMGSLYVKNPVALERLLTELRKEGYVIENLRNAEYRKSDNVSVEEMEKNGWSLWFAKLPDIRYGLCGSCQQLISVSGIRTHAHKCEKCGAVTYYELIEGSTLTFVFNNDGETGFFTPQLRMKVKMWDIENGNLCLYPEFLEGGLSVVTGKRAEDYLKRNKGKWSYGLIGGEKMIIIKYDFQWDRRTAMIEPYDSNGHVWNHKIVKVWDGKQYDDFDHLPVPESISIYESWHWTPLPVTSDLHTRILRAAGQTDDQGWHYQDGSPWFKPGHWKEMAKFVRHFTQLNADAFDLAWPTFRSDGPGGIADLAHFCHPGAVVRNDPNIGNVIFGLGKAFEGRRLTEQEIKAAKHGLEDPLVKRIFLSRKD